MSAEATGYVFRMSPYRGAAFCCHLAVADSVNDQHENEFFMAQGKLAVKARVGRPTANAALQQMVRDGYLEIIEDGARLPRGIVRYRFIFVRGEPTYDTRSVSRSNRSATGRPVGSGDKNRSRQRTSDLSPGETQNPKREPKGEKTLSPQAAQAREIATEHWERCKAEDRPTPVVKRGRSGSEFMAMAKIIERLLDAGHPREDIGEALWITDGGHTLQGLGVSLCKIRARRQRAEEAEQAEILPGRMPDPRVYCGDCEEGWLYVEGGGVTRCPKCNAEAVA